MKQKIETSLEKQNMDEINKLNQKIIDIEKESNDLSKNLSNLQSFEKELKKNIKKFEEKESNLLEKIKSLESKNTKNKEILNSKMQKTSSSYEYVALESKIKLLESQIATMEDENREPVESAPHPKQEIWIDFGEKLEPGYLLRRKE